MSVKKQLGAELKRIRTEKKVSAYNVSKVTKIAPQCLKSIENGETNYTIEPLIKICEHIELNLVISSLTQRQIMEIENKIFSGKINFF